MGLFSYMSAKMSNFAFAMESIEEKKVNIVSHAMKSGLVLGGSLSLLMFFERLVSMTWLDIVANIGSILLVFFCIFHYTNAYKEDLMISELYSKEGIHTKFGYLHAFKYGMFMFFFGGMILAVSTYLYYRVFPDALQAQIDAVTTLMGDKEEYKEAVQAMKSYTVNDFTISTFSGFVFIGLLLCLVTSLHYNSFTNKK